MSVISRISTVLVMSACIASSAAAAEKTRPTPQRLAWTGVVRGPLSPTDATVLEQRLLKELSGYEAFRVVDARGNALDPRLWAADAARAARLRDEGVDAFLQFKHKIAIAKLGQAIAVFEQRLTGLSDYEILQDALLARAESLYQSGEKGAAKASLKNWLALKPDKVPTTKTHPKGFVRLYKKAKAQLGVMGRIQIECEDPGCSIRLDGQVMGAAPLLATKIRPGQHYLVAKWPHSVLHQVVRVAPGRETKVVITREGPSESARQALLGVVRLKQGFEEAQALHGRVAGLARANHTLIASVYQTPEGRFLLLAKHDADGDLNAVIRAPLGAKMDDADTDRAVRQAGAALFVDRKEGELDLDPKRGVLVARGLAAVLYRGQGSTEAKILSPEPTPTAPPPPDGQLVMPPPPPPPPDGVKEDEDLLGAWWLWAAIGVVVVGGAVAAGAVLTKEDPTTTVFEVQLP